MLNDYADLRNSLLWLIFGLKGGQSCSAATARPDFLFFAAATFVSGLVVFELNALFVHQLTNSPVMLNKSTVMKLLRYNLQLEHGLASQRKNYDADNYRCFRD